MPVFIQKHMQNDRLRPCRNDEKKPFFLDILPLWWVWATKLSLCSVLLKRDIKRREQKEDLHRSMFLSIEYLVVMQLVVVGNNKHIPSDDNDNNNNNNNRDETLFTLHFTSCKVNAMAYSHIRLDVKCEMWNAMIFGFCGGI